MKQEADPVPTFKKAVNRSLRSQAYESIREAIIKGKLQPGVRLREVELSEQIGMSRGPIREALRQLEQEGFIISHPYRDTVVVETCQEEVTEVFVPIRRIVEIYAATRAHKVLIDKDFDYLSTLVDRMEAAHTKDDLDELADCDLKFHHYLIQKAGGHDMLRIWNSITSKIYPRFLIQGIKHASFLIVVKEHRTYLALIREGDSGKIVSHVQTHIT
jgi:DNA-binding GntR family transcriptional regulator